PGPPQRRDRRAALPQPAHRQVARGQHLRQARRGQPRRRHPLRPGPRPRL
ncbi:MAG: hypothetical protein AVDCRST_MAG88-3581, partial [uncultured Thermomicrobiales bacterium]